MASKTPQQVMDDINAMIDALVAERAHAQPGSSKLAAIDTCIDRLSDVLSEIITQDLASRTAQLTKLNNELVGATKKLKDLKTSIDDVIALLGAVQAIVKTGTALLPLL